MVIACGVWSPKLARMAGATIPLTPAIHQMIDIGPVPRFAGAKKGIEWPIVRDMDTNMYERQDGTGLEIGSYAHRPILHDPEEIPSIEESALSPTEFPFTEDDFALQMEQALELMPEIVGDESVGIKYAINGLLSLTPDGLPLLGETPEVRRAVERRRGVGEGGAGRRQGGRRVDDARRERDRPPVVRHRALLPVPEDARERARAGRRGLQQDLRHRPSRRAVGLEPRRAAAAVPRARGGARRGVLRDRRLGAAVLVRVERGARRAVRARRPRARVGRALVVADHQRRAPGDARDGGDVRPVGVRHLRHRRRRARWTTVQRVAMRQMDVPVGRAVYTPLLTPGGGFRSDLTILRLADDRFRVVTGGLHGMADLKWCRDHADGAVVTDLTGRLDDARAVGAAGARHPLEPHARRRLARGLPVRALPLHRDRAAAGAGAAHLLRRRPRLGAARADRAGRARCGTCSGRPASRTASSPPGSASTARRAGSRRATARSASSSTPSTTWSRPTWRGARSRTRTSSAARRTCATASPSRPRSCAR